MTGANRTLQVFRALFELGDPGGLVQRFPFKRLTEVVVSIRKSDEHSQIRRLDADSDKEGRPSAMTTCEGSWWRRSGMRRGELNSLQWRQIEGVTLKHLEGGGALVKWAPRAEIVLPWDEDEDAAGSTGSVSSRCGPCSSAATFDPDGETVRPEDAFVFGNELGQTGSRDTKRSWNTAVLKAHGHTTEVPTATCNLRPE